MSKEFEQTFMKFLQMASELYKEMERQKQRDEFDNMPPEVYKNLVSSTKKYFPNFDEKSSKR